MTDYRNRIKTLEYVNADELVAHPGNWRYDILLVLRCNLWYNLTNQDGQNAISSLREMRGKTPIHEQPNLRRVSQEREQKAMLNRRVRNLDRGGGGYMSNAPSFTEKHYLWQLPRMWRGIAQTLSQGGM